MNIISVHYNEIKSLFKSRSYKSNTVFDEDSFNDAFIKCANRFGNMEITYDTATKYFWAAYINTFKTNKIKESKLETVELDVDVHDCIDEPDTNIYNIVMDAISFKYGENLMLMYSLYKFHNWSKTDLIMAGYDIDDDFDYHIKEIHKFVKTYCKNHIKGLL